MPAEKLPESHQPRVIRVFVSSTFRDMHQERDELVKFTFPQLRKLCEERAVAWGEVDLRWGITDEQKAEGKVLPICLAEIHRCRPYFIGLLGERYGWVPNEIPQEVLEQEPWLVEHIDHSVTELEIIHGVLRNPEMADHAYFYFRDPAYINTLTGRQRADFQEQPTEEEIKEFGEEEAEQRAKARKQKLKELKEKIKKSVLSVRENYPDPKKLGELVLQDLTEVIDRLYPEEKVPDSLDREAAEHEAFAESRRGVYIGRQEYFDRLDEHILGDGPPLVVLGESGMGKSALLANWAIYYRKKHPGEILLMYFIGSSPQSTDWMAMLRRIMGESMRQLNIQQDIPNKPEELRTAFANCLYLVAAKGRAIIILDGLNQLEDRDQAPDLVWLPPEIPSNVRLVLSTLPGRSLDDLKKRKWPTMQIEKLNSGERRELIKGYLAQYTKALSMSQVERIVAVEQTANPLYLRALLEELRIFGRYEQLKKRIGFYLESKTIPELYEKILRRYEQDYERDCPDLVKNSMGLLWAARRGLSETEILEMLGSDGEPLPSAYWSPLYLAAEQALVKRSGLIGFFHDYFRQAVQNRYLTREQVQKESHLRIAEYFETRDLGPRKVDELPWQLARSKSWRRLYDLLSDLRFFDTAWKANDFEVKAYWSQIEANSKLKMIKAYRAVIEAPEDYLPYYVFGIASLLYDKGRLEESLVLIECLAKHNRKNINLSGLALVLALKYAILCTQGEWVGAMELCKEMEGIARKLGNKPGIQIARNGQAYILLEWGKLDEALALSRKSEQFFRQLGDKVGINSSLILQAAILHAQGDLDGSLAVLRERASICRELGKKEDFITILGKRAAILRNRGNLDEAMTLHRQEEEICREIGDIRGLGRSFTGQANVMYDKGELDAAMILYKKDEEICRQLGDKNGLSMSLNHQANILHARGELDAAMTLYKEQERLCRELGSKSGISLSLGNQAHILMGQDDLDGAMELAKEQERICRELEDKSGMESSFSTQASILYERRELAKALALYKECQSICLELGAKNALQRCLGNQAIILEDLGELEGALALLKEKENACRDLGSKIELATSLGNQAHILYVQGNLTLAKVLHKQEEKIWRECGNLGGLYQCLGNQAVIMARQGKIPEALRLRKEEEKICREMGYHEGLSINLINQAMIMAQHKKEMRIALNLAEEAYDIVRRNGLVDLEAEIKPILEIIRSQAS